METDTPPTVLITGAAKRIGAVIARHLHGQRMNIILHYHTSAAAAQALQSELTKIRPDSACIVQGDLSDISCLPTLVAEAVACWGRLDVLINNASGFYSTPLEKATEQQWEDLLGSNLKGPFFLCQAAVPHLRKHQGCIINMVDIYADRPMPAFPIYNIAKAGMVMLTKTLAWELSPAIRVNGIAPGMILWADAGAPKTEKQNVLKRIPLQRIGDPLDLARTAAFLIRDAGYITGQILPVDGGRTLNM